MKAGQTQTSVTHTKIMSDCKKDNEDFMKDIKKTLTRVLFLQNVAGARNVSYLTRLEALHEDVACVVTGEEPTSSQRVVENTRLPDRC